jgi:cell division septal protein FtsQ
VSDDVVVEPRRPRWGRRLIAVAVLLAVVSPWWAPPILRQLAFFRVRHVDVRGYRYTAPKDLVARLRIDTTFSLWNDLEPLERRLRADPAVAQVRLSRRLPATLVVTIVENDPVALVSSSTGFRAYDTRGRLLPLDPSRTPVDLPILARADTMLLRLLGEIKASHPDLFARVSEMRRVGRDELVMELVTIPVRMMKDISVDRLAQISLVERDLERRRARVSELDLRFRDQVIARPQ